MKGWLPDWAGMFVPDLSPAETFLRVTVVYLGIVVLFRIVLKRQSGSLGLTDVLLIVLVSECASPSLAGKADSITNGLVAVGTLLFWSYVLDRLSHRWAWLRRLLEPEPVQLVCHGQPLQAALDDEGVTREELDAQLRLAGLEDVRQAKAVMLESDGNVSVIPRDDVQALLARLRRAADDLDTTLARLRNSADGGPVEADGRAEVRV